MVGEHHSTFEEVLRVELRDIAARREHPRRAPISEEGAERKRREQQELRRQALGMDLTGLALSGGGIRSATFALGFLQGLASLDLLRRFDYLSTVSGGGYIGSWFAAWVKRRGSLEEVEQQLKPGRPTRPSTDKEPEPIFHLRAYSSYLAPRRGIFSADSSVLVATYLRNIVLNQLVLLPLCMVVLLVPRFLERLFNWVGTRTWDRGLAGLMFVALAFGLLSITIKNRLMTRKKWRIQAGVRFFHGAIIFPLFLFAVLASWFLSWDLTPVWHAQGAGLVGTAAPPTGFMCILPAASVFPQDTPWWVTVQKRLPWDNLALRNWELKRNRGHAVFFGHPTVWSHFWRFGGLYYSPI
jgi:hypothetical protein